MNSQADHLHFSLKLDFASNGISIPKPLDGNYHAILYAPLVDIPGAAFPDQVLAAEVVGGGLKFPEVELLQVSKGDVLVMPL